MQKGVSNSEEDEARFGDIESILGSQPLTQKARESDLQKYNSVAATSMKQTLNSKNMPKSLHSMQFDEEIVAPLSQLD